jgi:hypothetical protein
MTKLKIGIAGLVVAAGVTTPLVIQYRHSARLSRENFALRQQVDQLAKIRDAVEKLPTLQPDADNAEALRKQQLELLRLRGMIGVQGRQETELRRQLEAAQSQADLARFQLHLAQSGPGKAWSDVVKPTPLPGNFEISTLRPAGRDTAAHAAQSILYAVFHNAGDVYHDLAPDPPAENDPMYYETLARTRRLWGGDAAQSIKNLEIAPMKDGRYMVHFRIDYGANGRPTGDPTHGDIMLQQTPDGFEGYAGGSSMETPPSDSNP